MTSSLPSRPSLVQLRKQAKELLKAYRDADASCLRILRHLPPLEKASSTPVPGVEISLADVQFALAREYGFANWAALKAQLSPQPSIEGVNDHREPFFESTAARCVQLQTRGSLRWLEPIPRFPLKVRQVDESGKTVRQVTGPREMIHGLAYAMRMLGHDIPLHLVLAASGEAFRFTFSDTWHYDAKSVSPVDAAARACCSLGFDCMLVAGQTWQDAWRAVEAAIDQGRPVLVGTDPSYWRLVIGLDRSAGEYLYVGDDPWSQRVAARRGSAGATCPDLAASSSSANTRPCRGRTGTPATSGRSRCSRTRC